MIRYYIGLDKVSENPYDRTSNPDGIIQLGLPENRLCFVLIEKWMAKNLRDSIMGTDGGDLNILGIATYQPFDGLMELKAIANFKSQVVGRAVLFDSLQMVLTAGATPAVEILCFCLAGH
ncbi:hypothetical protein GH714_026726 [Hevea brasiliensis]|uniref:Uncharacterized protein n=1 Tax=Hevea brasiliensis TaxID=3981 RepID=A0A6A6MIF2_HEVBR|nr:hypothetical protein GH714_026726 [Hevea brasiliensis]